MNPLYRNEIKGNRFSSVKIKGNELSKYWSGQ